MSAKYFCDWCGCELPADRQRRVRGSVFLKDANDKLLKTMTVEVLTSFDGVANAGDFCKTCVKEAVVEVVDRDEDESVPTKHRKGTPR